MLNYKIAIKTSDGRHFERWVDLDPNAVYWPVTDILGNFSSSDIASVEIQKLDPPKTYTVKLTEKERNHLLGQMWLEGIGKEIRNKIRAVQPDCS